MKLKNIKVDTMLLILTLALMLGYHFFVYFNSSWEVSHGSIHQIRNDNLIVIACSFFSFLSMLVLVMILIFTKKFPAVIAVPICLMFIFGIVWTAYSLFFDNISITLLLRDSFPPVSMLTCGMIFVGYCDKWWVMLKKFFFFIAVFFVFYSFIEILIAYLDFGFEYRITYGAPMYLYIIGLYSTYGIILLSDDWKKNKKFLMFILIILLILNSAILQGRSWFIQTLFLFVLYISKIRRYFRYNPLAKLIITLSILFSVFFVFTINNELFIAIFDRFENSGDTRTWQLEAFFNQVNIKELFIGGGISASYSFNGDRNYRFIDNQILLYMFRYGIVPTLIYMFLLIYPIYKSFVIDNKSLIIKNVVLISWILSMLGLSVYFSISFGMVHYLIMIYIGRLVYELKQTKNKRIINGG